MSEKDVNLSGFLAEARRPLEALVAHSRKLASRWEPTGLLEGLNDRDRSSMAVLLENQAVELLTENSKTGGASAEQWNGVALPLVRKVFGEVSAKEFVSVQPMNLPSGLVFYLDFQYGTAIGPRNVGESVYGITSGTNGATQGLYGAGRFAYSVNDVTGSGFAAQTSSAATSASTNWEISATGLVEITVPFSSLSGADKTTVRSFVPSASNATGSTATASYYPQYTRLSADQNSVIFVLAGSGNTTITKVTYNLQPSDSSRGDFEDTVGSSIPPTGANLGIPEININLRSEMLVAKTRKLKAVWTPELAQDLNAYQSVNAEEELAAILSEHVALEIDLEILDMLIAYADTTDYWSAKIGNVWNPDTSTFVSDPNLAGQAWTTMTWYQTLGNVMQRVSNRIHQRTLRGGANFAVVSPSVATIIETIPGFTAKTDGNQSNFAMGVSAVGSFQNRFTIYKNPYFLNNVMLLGFRGKNFLETGAVYAPYIPLIMTPLLYDPENFTPRRGLMTRYAKKMIRNEFFGKIILQGIQ